MFQPISTLNKDNFVIINIWTSAENKAIPGSNVGHVSLQTKLSYMSLWPGMRRFNKSSLNRLEKFYLRYFGERPASFKANYEEDCALEALSEEKARDIQHIKECVTGEIPYLFNSSNGRVTVIKEQPQKLDDDLLLMAIKPISANVRIVLYSLRTDSIENEFSQLNKLIRGWRLIGSNVISRMTDDSAESCSSLAYRLLGAGGLYKHLDGRSSSENSSVVSPDDLVKHTIAYKEKELRVFPMVSQWYRQNPLCSDESNYEDCKKALENDKKSKSSLLSAMLSKT